MALGVPRWHMTGSLIGACNCEWGCPCNFDAPPDRGFCEGAYVFVLREGRFGEVPLDGVTFVTAGRAPGPIHEGGLTSAVVVDDRTTEAQRRAIERLWRGGGVGLPFDIFASVTSTWLPPLVASIEVGLDGIRSTVRVAGGAIYELGLSRIVNPVSGREEEIHLDKPTGFTSQRSELGASVVARFSADGLAFDNSGRYAEYAEFRYAGP